MQRPRDPVSPTPAAPIFAGLRVIDCASFIAGPAAATILADFGAEVIKIEPPIGGDPYRGLAAMPGQPTSPHNYNWLLDARHKRSLALDLKSTEGRAILHRLVASADVFITNMPLPVRGRLGIAHADLAARNPRLIYASLTAYGEIGEEAGRTGFDSTAYWARSGLMDQVRPSADTPPARSVPGMGDHPTAMALYAAIVTALLKRERTGQGGHVETSLLANGLWSNACFVQAALCGATFYPRPPREQAPNACTHHYQSGDGRWFILSMLSEERQFPDLARAIGQEHLSEDPRFATTAARHANAASLIALLDGVFAAQPLAYWRETLNRHGLTFGVVATMDDPPQDRQARAIGALVPLAEGELLTVSSPFQIAGEHKIPPRRAPELGADTSAILRELGVSEGEIERLRGLGVVAGGTSGPARASRE